MNEKTGIMSEKIDMSKEYQEMVGKSIFKQYTLADRQKLGMEPVEKVPVFRQGCWTLFRCQPSESSASYPVLMIPSLINRPYIMNLLPGHSLFEAIKSAGLDLFILDWGEPDAGMGNVGFDQYIGTWIRRAVRHVKRVTGKKKVQLAGQCIGGLMAAMYAAHPELKKDIHSLFLLTAPIDLADSGILADWTTLPSFDIEKMTAPFQGIVPADFFHASFPFLDPKKQLGKYRTLEENFSLPGFKKIWQSLDVWATDNVPFAKRAFIELIMDFYQKNAFFNGTFVIRGARVRPQDIDVPTLALVAKEDHVFSEKAAAAIKLSKTAQTGKLTYKVMGAGHVTLICAHPARVESYKVITEFLGKTQ